MVTSIEVTIEKSSRSDFSIPHVSVAYLLPPNNDNEHLLNTMCSVLRLVILIFLFSLAQSLCEI
jgi:hypothetical protein